MTTQPEALDLADWLESVSTGLSANKAAAELRRLHAENEALRAERNRNLDSIQVGNNIIQRIKDENEALRAALEHPAQQACQTCGSDCNERDELIKAEREIERLNEELRFLRERPAQEPQQLKSPCARQCEAQAFKIEIRQLTRLVADYMEIIAKQRVAMKEAHRVLGTLDVSITSRTLGARCGLADAMELRISPPQPAQQTIAAIRKHLGETT